jgi:hypothetical protein
MTDQAHVVDEFALDDDGARADNSGGLVADDEDVVGVVAGGNEVVAGGELGGGGFAYCGEDAEGWEVAYMCSRRLRFVFEGPSCC